MTVIGKEKAKDAKAVGMRGEDAAAAYLRSKGVVIRARNFRTRLGEIDIVGEYDGVVLFVEVKTRSGTRRGRAGEAVDFRKQRRIIAAAQCYLQKNNLLCCPCRFDVVEVYPRGDGTFVINDVEGAFEA